MNHSDIIELLNTHSGMRVTQAALRSAGDAITSRFGEEFAGSCAEDGNRLVKEMKDSAARLEFDIAEVEGEIVQALTDLQKSVASLEARVAELEEELRLKGKPPQIWSGWSL